MAITERQRLDLRQRLDEVLGEDLAEVAMEAMPPLDYDKFATRQDVANLGVGVRGEMATIGADLRSEMTALSTNLRGEMAALNTDLRGEIGRVRIEMVTGFADIKTDMGKQFRQYFFANLVVMLTMLGFVVGLN